MSNKADELYVSDVVESEKKSCEYGDAQVLVAGEKEKVENYEKSGNQSKDYYSK